MKKGLILFVLLCLSCTNKKQELEYLICKDSIQFWNYEWPRDRSEFYSFTFSFDNEGNVVKYSYNKIKNKRIIFTDHPKQFKKKWNVTNDSIFTFFGSAKKIIRYTEDSIFVVYPETKEIGYFLRVKNKLNIQKYEEIDKIN
ncbi:hypothetical protein [Flavobacterium sp. MMS24-S5]|uniref:hypothetical protein n=1 Tax=Flavobacterium sp. MMS24-S5 TaxID=3416605 RepID=UPI003D05F194